MMTVASLAACAGSASTVAEAPVDGPEVKPSTVLTSTPTAQSRWTSCAVNAPVGDDGRPPNALTLPHLGNDLAVASAVHCQLGPKRRADGGEEVVLTEGRASDLTALRPPDDTTAIEACTADMPWEPNLLLFDAQGQWIRLGLPVDTCESRSPRYRRRCALCG